jgi:hypothetical protein
MKYGVPTKVKAKTGDLIKFTYSKGTNKTPSLLFLTTIQTKSNHKLICGFNMNYIKPFLKQRLLYFYAREKSRTMTTKNLYKHLIVKFPDLKQAYRVYSVIYITNPRKFDFMTWRLKDNK